MLYTPTVCFSLNLFTENIHIQFICKFILISQKVALYSNKALTIYSRKSAASCLKPTLGISNRHLSWMCPSWALGLSTTWSFPHQQVATSVYIHPSRTPLMPQSYWRLCWLIGDHRFLFSAFPVHTPPPGVSSQTEKGFWVPGKEHEKDLGWFDL